MHGAGAQCGVYQWRRGDAGWKTAYLLWWRRYSRLLGPNPGERLGGLLPDADMIARRILPLGDSLTHGSPDLPGGYRGILEAELLRAGINFEFIGSSTSNSDGMRFPHHEGHPGFRIEELRMGHTNECSQSPPVAETLERFKPDQVLLLVGTNNLYLDPPDCAAGEMARLLDEIWRESSVRSILVAGLPPILPGPKPWGMTVPPDVGERVIEFNRALSALTADHRAKGRDMSMVDMHPCIVERSDWLDDGVHPAPAAVRRIAAQWLQEVIH